MAWPPGSFGEFWDIAPGTDLVNATYIVHVTRANGAVDQFRVTVGIDPELSREEAQDVALQDALDAVPIAINPVGTDVSGIFVELDPEVVF
jgi:hypothetical protein